MKVCPVCNQTYVDDNLNYCLNDGGTLNASKDDAPPTVAFNRARTTQQNWEDFQPPSPWESQIQQNQPFQTVQQDHTYQPLQQNQAYNPALMQNQNQTLPVVSMILGILSTLFACCYGGIPLGAAAIVLGFLGLRNFNENSMRFGGRGLAIAGIVTGVIGLLISLGLFLIVIISK